VVLNDRRSAGSPAITISSQLGERARDCIRRKVVLHRAMSVCDGRRMRVVGRVS